MVTMAFPALARGLSGSEEGWGFQSNEPYKLGLLLFFLTFLKIYF